MRTLKLISTNFNAQSVFLVPTSLGADGKIRSLKKDGGFISGRQPLKEEEPLLWVFRLTSKEMFKGNNTKLYSKIYVPQEGIDFNKGEESDEIKAKLNLYRFISEHMDVFYFETIMENGEPVKKQMNKNWRRNHTLSFELIDETAKEEALFNKDRQVTKFLSLIDDMYDEDQSGNGSFLDMCFGMNVSGCYKNVKKRNYNLLTDKVRISPESFERYWNDPDRAMMIVINKGKKIEYAGGEPLITQDSNQLYFYKDILLGGTDAELKLYFKNTPDEYEYLKKAVGEVAVAKKPVVEKEYKIDEPVSKSSIQPSKGNMYKDGDFINNQNYAIINKEIGLLLGLTKKARNENSERGLHVLGERLERDRVKFQSNLTYFEQRLKEQSIQKGIEIHELITI